MDALIALIGTVVVEVAKCVYPPVALHVSCCIRSKKIVKKLEIKVEELKTTRIEVQNIVDEADNKLESIKKTVKDWFERVDKETSSTTPDDEVGSSSMNNGGAAAEMNGKDWCFCRTRYDIGRDAQKKMVIIEELITQGKSFDINNVSDSSTLVGTEFIPTNEDFEDFASRKSSKDQIIAALKDDKTSLVGVYGMGGVGKTMLVNQVHKLVMKEKLFDAVAKITVSETVDLKKIQNEIASQLGCLEQLKKTEDTQTRAEMLRVRLMKPNQKFLVILDDMWTTELGLSDVGIPTSGSGATCCKVVITTRNLNVCDLLGSQKNIQVRVLSEEESWHLFKKNVAEDVVTSTDLLQVARDVANECGGLPIAIVTLGKSLRKKDKSVWDDTLSQLKSSDFSPIEETKSKVFTSIKLSYNHLGNTFLKKCFLLCSMFPEDHRISIVELMMHVMGDDEILKNMAGSTLEKVRDRLHNMLDKLMASCLLFGRKKDDGRISEVWMHDIVRYVALQIASEEGSGFFASEEENWRLLSRSNTGKFLRVLLIRHEISVLPEQPQLPDNLLCLSLEGNRSLTHIPESFFQKVESLAILNLSETGISSLPSSLSCLTNLRSLHLGKCALHKIDVSVIGKLNKLEILNLSGCGLSSLPEEIGGLPNLRLLDLSKNHQLNFIPPNVISRLSLLEELYMLHSFSGWKVEPTEDGSRASLDEVTSLKSVQLAVYNDEIKAQISTVSVYRKWKLIDLRIVYRGFGSYLTAPSPICHSIRVLLARVDDLMLYGCTGLKSVGQLVIGDGFKNMKILGVERCNEMEYLMSVVEGKIPKTTFIALETLYLYGLFNLKEILHGPMPVGFLDKLEQVYVEYCHNLVSIFSPDVWVKLKNLHGLYVVNCEKLKEVFYLKEEEGCRLNKQDGHVHVTFPKLKKLYLESLPELTIIWKGVFAIESLQNLKVIEVIDCDGLRYLFSTQAMVLALEQLEKLKISNCEGMAAIAAPLEETVLKDQVLIPPHTSNALPPQIFPNLRELVIYKCNSLKDLYPLKKLSHGGLSQLRRLEVWNCKNLEEIFLINTDEEEDHDGNGKAMLPQLEKLSLQNLPSLIWNIPIGSLQNLKEVSLEHLIFPVSLVLGGGLSQLQKLDIKGCKGLKVIIDIDVDQQVLHHQLNWSILLPRLKTIVLDDLPNLMAITKGVIMSFGSFENLEELDVRRCNSLKHLLPIRLLVNGGLPKLKGIWVEECNEMEVIFNEDGGDHDQYNHCKSKMVVAFPHLKVLSLVFLPKLSKFHQGPPILDWPFLERLDVIRCENLKRLPFNHPHSLFPKLEDIYGDSERWFDEELEWEDESLKSRLKLFFREDCSISSSNNLGGQQSSSSYPAFFDLNIKPNLHFFTEASPQAHHEIETLPLLTMHPGGNDISRFCTEVSTPDHQYPSSGYNHTTSGGTFNFYIPQHHDNKSGSARISLELTLNSYTPITPDHTLFSPMNFEEDEEYSESEDEEESEIEDDEEE